MGLIQRKLIAQFLVFRPVDDLPEAHKGRNVLRIAVRQPCTQLRAPAAAQKVHLFPAVFPTQPKHKLVGIVHKAVDRQRLHGRPAIRTAAAPLVPCDNKKLLLQVCVHRHDCVAVAHTRAAMQKQQHRLRFIAFDMDLLRQAAQRHFAFPVDHNTSSSSFMFLFCITLLLYQSITYS